MRITILFFGNLTQITGCNKLPLENLRDIEEVKEYLIAKFPIFKNQKYAVAINRKIVKDNQLLNDGDEIAFLPPFAGG
jgi:sulfur-carrier protein